MNQSEQIEKQIFVLKKRLESMNTNSKGFYPLKGKLKKLETNLKQSRHQEWLGQ